MTLPRRFASLQAQAEARKGMSPRGVEKEAHSMLRDALPATFRAGGEEIHSEFSRLSSLSELQADGGQLSSRQSDVPPELLAAQPRQAVLRAVFQPGSTHPTCRKGELRSPRAYQGLSGNSKARAARVPCLAESSART